MRPGETLLTLLEKGEADAIPAFRHEAIERRLPFISLVPQINLGDPNFAGYYKHASCRQVNGSFTFGKPIVYDITIPNTVRNTEGSIQFVKFLFSDQGKKILKIDGLKLIPLAAGGNITAIPKEFSLLIMK